MGKGKKDLETMLDIAEDELALEGTGTDEDMFVLLDPYILPAEAGISDVWLSERACVPLDIILLWKKDRGISPRPRVTAALELIGDGSRALVQMAKSSILEGAWRVPEFIVRSPLNYDKLAEICHFMVIHSDMEVEDLAAGLGLEQEDVSSAVVLYKRATLEGGKFCRTCGRPSLKDSCSMRCDV